MNELRGLMPHQHISRVATVREKYLENEIFFQLGKSRGILWMARQGKVREFENKWPWQAVSRKFDLFNRGKDVLSFR